MLLQGEMCLSNESTCNVSAGLFYSPLRTQVEQLQRWLGAMLGFHILGIHTRTQTKTHGWQSQQEAECVWEWDLVRTRVTTKQWQTPRPCSYAHSFLHALPVSTELTWAVPIEHPHADSHTSLSQHSLCHLTSTASSSTTSAKLTHYEWAKTPRP